MQLSQALPCTVECTLANSTCLGTLVAGQGYYLYAPLARKRFAGAAANKRAPFRPLNEKPPYLLKISYRKHFLTLPTQIQPMLKSMAKRPAIAASSLVLPCWRAFSGLRLISAHNSRALGCARILASGEKPHLSDATSLKNWSHGTAMLPIFCLASSKNRQFLTQNPKSERRLNFASNYHNRIIEQTT